MNSGLITTDLQGRITFTNRAASQNHRHAGRDLAGRSVAAFLGAGDSFLGEVRAALERANRFRFEKEFTARDGAGLFLDSRVDPAEQGGDALGSSSSSRT